MIKEIYIHIHFYLFIYLLNYYISRRERENIINYYRKYLPNIPNICRFCTAILYLFTKITFDKRIQESEFPFQHAIVKIFLQNTKGTRNRSETVPGASYKAENNHALAPLGEKSERLRDLARESGVLSRFRRPAVAGATSQIEISPIFEGNPGMIPVALYVYAGRRAYRSFTVIVLIPSRRFPSGV